MRSYLPVTDYDIDAAPILHSPPESNEIREYEAFLRQEIPMSLRRELEARVDTLLDNAEETLRSELPNIFRDLQIELFSTFLRTRRGRLSDSEQPALAESAAPKDATNDDQANEVSGLNNLAPFYPTPFIMYELGTVFSGDLFHVQSGDLSLPDLTSISRTSTAEETEVPQWQGCGLFPEGLPSDKRLLLNTSIWWRITLLAIQSVLASSIEV